MDPCPHPSLLQTWGLAPHPSSLGKALPHSGPQGSHLEAEDKTEQAPRVPRGYDLGAQTLWVEEGEAVNRAALWLPWNSAAAS